MIRTALFASAAALCLAPMAQGQSYPSYGYQDGYQVRQSSGGGCERERDDNRVAGTIIGAVAGGLLGAAIADNDGGHHGYRSRGYRGHRGYGRHRGHHRGGDGDEIAGALIGGVLGAVVGGEIASSGTDCQTRNTRYAYDNIAPPTRQAFAPSQPYQTAAPAYTTQPQYPAQSAYPAVEQPLYGGPADPITPPSQPVRITRTDVAPQCQTVQRETRLPDGSVVREPVSVCQGSNGEWQMQEQVAGY